jgi:O-antigen/teichoic acid export membrane protein
MIILGKDILSLYANEEIGELGWVVIPIVAISTIFNGLILIKANILFVRLRTRYLLIVNMIACVINILINIILLRIFGNIIFSAIASLLTYFISYIIINKILDKDFVNFRLNINEVIHIVISSIIMLISLEIFNNGIILFGYDSILMKIIFSITVYLIIMSLKKTNRLKLNQALKIIQIKIKNE